MVTKLSPQARYERREAVKAKVAAQLRAELFAATVAAFPELAFTLQPFNAGDRGIGITIGLSNQDTTLPKLERWAFVHSYTLAELLDLLGAEAGRRVAMTRLGDVSVAVDTIGKAVGDAADLD